MHYVYAFKEAQKCYVKLTNSLDKIQNWLMTSGLFVSDVNDKLMDLNRKLKNIDNLNNKKRLIAKYYYLHLKNKKIQLFDIGLKSCFHQFVILVKKRSEFLKYLDIFIIN